MSIWDTPELKIGGDFVRFDKPGDTISGTIQVVRAHKFDDGGVAPQILLVTDQGEEKTVTAGQVRLKVALAEQRPEAGDHIQITLTQIEPRAGGKSLKHFSVVVTRGNGAPAASVAQPTIGQGFAGQPPAAPAAPAPMAPPAPQYAPPAVPQAAPAAPAAAGMTPEQQAAIAALTPEQRAAMGWTS
jgi:hypothetical protein